MKNKYLLSLVVGVILLISTMIMGMISNTVIPGLMAEYEGPGFRPMEDPLWAFFPLYPIVLGIAMSHLWFRTRKSWKNGTDFGLVIGIFLSVPMFLVNISSFSFSLPMIFSWSVFGFLNSLVAGIALEKLGD